MPGWETVFERVNHLIMSDYMMSNYVTQVPAASLSIQLVPTTWRGNCIDVCLFALQNVDAFKLIMSGASGGSNEKRLASQFIARFHKYFPSLFDKCLDVMMDLCEDSDVAVSSAQHIT